MDKKGIESLLCDALDLEGAIEEAQEAIRAKSKAAYSQELLDARLQSVAVLAWSMNVRAGVPGKTDPSRSDRLGLHAAFLQGIGLTEQAISEGQYMRSAAILKQDVEIVARVEEIKAGAARAGRTPNVKHVPGVGSTYGQLNELAHVALPTVLAQTLNSTHEGAVHGVSPVPGFLEPTAVQLYEIHVFLCWRMAIHALDLLFEMYDDLSATAPEAEAPIRLLVSVHEVLRRRGRVG